MAMRIYVSSEEAAFFNNNKMGYADSIPTSGSYKVGDFMISSTQLDGIFGWVCTEEGTPGKWEVIGSGAGGGKLVSINATKVVDAAVNQISLAELGLVVGPKDKLMVHFNSMFLMEGIDYKVSEDGESITKLGEGYWNESNIEGCLFTFEVLKNVESLNTEEVKLDTRLLCEKNNVTVNEAVSEVNIGINGFDKDKDTLIVYKNATYLMEEIDYEISADSSKIVSLNGVWNENNDEDFIFTFVVFKEVITINPEAVVDTEHIVDGSVTMDKLSDDVKQAIEDASNIDLSGYAAKADVGDKSQLQTAAKDSLVDAVNELFQSANNGKELIANAIGEPLVSTDTFSAMSTSIDGLVGSFKTALMNNGVSVESADKFKALIDKLALLADNEGKGIQYTTGNIVGNYNIGSDDNGNALSSQTYTLSADFGFVPTLLFVYCNTYYSYNTTQMSGVVVSNLADFVTATTNSGEGLSLSNITENSFDLKLKRYGTKTMYVENLDWYAIGVGEEDTTLLDSLKSILLDESVEVTEDDDMASLIVKTDTEFANKNNEITNNKQALVDALNNKGIEVNIDNTYDELIDNIETIKTAIVASDNYRYNKTDTYDPNVYRPAGYRIDQYSYLMDSFEAVLPGSVRVKIYISNGHTKSGYNVTLTIKRVRNNETTDVDVITASYSTTIDTTVDIDLQQGDVLYFIGEGATSSTSYGYAYIYPISFGYDLV